MPVDLYEIFNVPRPPEEYHQLTISGLTDTFPHEKYVQCISNLCGHLKILQPVALGIFRATESAPFTLCAAFKEKPSNETIALMRDALARMLVAETGCDLRIYFTPVHMQISTTRSLDAFHSPHLATQGKSGPTRRFQI